ncbi:MAG: deoxyguanosine kinase/deoxyadenosine kinase [Porticoccaceae bacterium]|nr:MAG: deoxyguanosine kinase/deoxyadenosine kinase [Porticoccaceae bacterium]
MTDPPREPPEATAPHRFIAVEGSIGVGKTTLARRLAEAFGYALLLERAEENPFLEGFYREGRGALKTQLFFLFQRAEQLAELRQGDIFAPGRVADFLIHKDPLFARVTLDDDEFRLYWRVWEQLAVDVPRPDLVIFLQAPTEVLLERIRRRGVPMEAAISPAYLEALNEAYTRFFLDYDEAPLLIVNAAEIDLARGEADFRQLVAYLSEIRSGRHYYNPIPNR